MKKVKIDQDECIGCETCVELCPDVFAFDASSNKAYVTSPEGGDQKCIEEAVASCPVNCIANEEE
jgi:ferredoxin